MRQPKLVVSVYYAFLLLSFCFTSQFATAASQKKGSTSTAVEKRLENLAAKGPVVPLSASNFSRYAGGTASTRPYHVVLLFTSSSLEHKCVVCRPAEEAFGKVARAYKQQREMKQKQAGTSADEDLIVFAVVDAANAVNVFMEYHIVSAPHAYILPLGQTLPLGSEKSSMEITRSLSGGRSDGRSSEFASDISRATGIEIVVLPDVSGLLPSAVVLGIAMGFLARIFARVPARILRAVRYTGVWVVASTACYMTGIGGMIYCIIRNPHLHGFDPKAGAAAIFSSGGREQFWYEGVVIAAMNVAMAASIFGAYNAAGWKRLPSFLRGVAVMVCITALCYVAREYFKIYTMKTPWYSLDQMLPQGLTAFHTGKLKRSHGLMKRLARLSHMWLNEFTTLESFQKSLKSFLWDFILRKFKKTIWM